MCSGQSNMGMTVSGDWKAQVESLASNHPGLRLITVPLLGTQELKTDFEGKWAAANAQNCLSFTAVGFFYGRYLHEILGVPVGLINNSWGGSAAEAWVRRESLAKDERFAPLLKGWEAREAQLESAEGKARYETALAAWKEAVAEAKAAGKEAPRAPASPDQTLKGNARSWRAAGCAAAGPGYRYKSRQGRRRQPDQSPRRRRQCYRCAIPGRCA